MHSGPPPPPSSEPDPVLGLVIGRLREEHGLDQATLAERSTVSVETLVQIEKGLTDPAWETVERIARALGISIREIASEVVQQEETS